MSQFADAYMYMRRLASISKLISPSPNLSFTHTFCRYFKCITLKYAFFVSIVIANIFFICLFFLWWSYLQFMTGLGDGLEPTRHVTIQWSHGGLIQGRIYACYDDTKNELSRHSWRHKTLQQKGSRGDCIAALYNMKMENLTITNIKKHKSQNKTSCITLAVADCYSITADWETEN